MVDQAGLGGAGVVSGSWGRARLTRHTRSSARHRNQHTRKAVAGQAGAHGSRTGSEEGGWTSVGAADLASRGRSTTAVPMPSWATHEQACSHAHALAMHAGARAHPPGRHYPIARRRRTCVKELKAPALVLDVCLVQVVHRHLVLVLHEELAIGDAFSVPASTPGYAQSLSGKAGGSGQMRARCGLQTPINDRDFADASLCRPPCSCSPVRQLPVRRLRRRLTGCP